MKITAEKSKYGDIGWESDPQLFIDVVSTWRRWLSQANDHLYAAQVLLPHVEQWNLQIKRLMETKPPEPEQLPPALTGIYFLHCAFALENSFKGVIGAMLKEEVKLKMGKTRRLPKMLLGHDLIKLARTAGYQVDIDNEYVLKFLSRYGTWAGRYPLPLNNDDYGLTNRLSDGTHYMTAGYSPEQVPAFFEFCNTVYSWSRRKGELLS